MGTFKKNAGWLVAAFFAVLAVVGCFAALRIPKEAFVPGHPFVDLVTRLQDISWLAGMNAAVLSALVVVLGVAIVSMLVWFLIATVIGIRR